MIKLLLCHNLTDPRFAFFAATEDYFGAQGLEYAGAVADADIAFYCANMGFNYYTSEFGHFWSDSEPYSFERDMRNIDWLADRVEKIVVYIRDDGASLIDHYFDYWRARGPLGRIIVTKDFSFSAKFRSEILGRTFTQDGGGFYYHLTKILDAFPQAVSFTDYEPIQKVMKRENVELYAGIKIFTWRFHTYGWLGQGYERDIHQHKDIDLFYVKRYRKTIDGYFRREILDRVTKIRGLAKYTAPIDVREYVDTLCRSKIVIAPWGLGECVWDDWKASINGVLLLRPNTDYVDDYYGIYASGRIKNLHYFDADLSNFESCVDHILGDITRLHELAQDTRAALRSDYNLRRHADDFISGVVGE